jgi:hypothetical protein
LPDAARIERREGKFVLNILESELLQVELSAGTLEYQLELTLELLDQAEWPDFDDVEDLPPNITRLLPRVR